MEDKMPTTKELCTCEKSVPGFIKRADGRGDELVCLICLRKMDHERSVNHVQPEEFPGRVFRAYVQSLKDLQAVARVPRSLAEVQRPARHVVYLEHTLWSLEREAAYHEEGDFWMMEKRESRPGG